MVDIDPVAERECAEAYAVYEMQDELIELNDMKDDYNKLATEQENLRSASSKANDAQKAEIAKKIEENAKILEKKNKLVQKTQNEYFKRKMEMRKKFTGMTLEEKIDTAKMIRDNQGKNIVGANELMKSVERIAELNPRDPAFNEIQRKAENYLGKREGELDTREDLPPHMRKKHGLRPSRKDLEEKRKREEREARLFQREMKFRKTRPDEG